MQHKVCVKRQFQILYDQCEGECCSCVKTPLSAVPYVVQKLLRVIWYKVSSLLC